MITDYLKTAITEAVLELAKVKGCKITKIGEVTLEVPKAAQHGDYATNIAMVSASVFKMSPRQLASQIIERLRDPRKWIARVEIAGPGFINFFIADVAWYEVLKFILVRNESYGTAKWGRGLRVQVEFVSANPTGPLHVGHGRGAAVGDVIARALEATGHDVSREYYINDAGTQMDILGRSIYLRYLELFGRTVTFPENHYQGEYIKDLAKDVKEREGDRFLHLPEDEAVEFMMRYGGSKILDGIQGDLRSFGIEYDQWFSEKSLFEDGSVRDTIGELKRLGYVYEKDDAWWFKASEFGDEKDRVVIRSNGAMTYFASDIAYHRNKFERGYDKVIDVWGADHHGYVPRILAGIKALGRNDEALKIILVQLVNLLRHGQPVAMSTRAGEFVTLREVIKEVGKDAARYIFLTRRSDSHLDFDLELAKEKSSDNPVYYVQYAHARISSLFRVADEQGIAVDFSVEPDLRLLQHPQEKEMIRILAQYPEVVDATARFLEPHRLPYYLNHLVSVFHSYYNKNRVISDNVPLMKARFYLVRCVHIILKNALDILGVMAPDRM